MNEQRLLGDQASVKALADRLSKCPDVAKYDYESVKEGGVLAHALGDLEECFVAFLNEHLPRLMDDQSRPAEIFDALLDLGEEFRHILYHIHDPKFYQYLHREHDE
jgi:hypothetical protein